MDSSETAKPAVRCPNCGQPVKTWMQFFGEDCLALADGPSPHAGHLITPAQRIALAFEQEAQ